MIMIKCYIVIITISINTCLVRHICNSITFSILYDVQAVMNTRYSLLNCDYVYKMDYLLTGEDTDSAAAKLLHSIKFGYLVPLNLDHKVTGAVLAVSPDTLLLEKFTYDGAKVGEILYKKNNLKKY